MCTMERKSKKNKNDVSNSWTIRNCLQSGDIGYLAYLHGTVYSKEYGYDQTFEAYVAKGLAEFVVSFNPEKERLWVVEMRGQIVGFVAIVCLSVQEAQLRWFFVLPDFRGRGIGKQLLTEVVLFCKKHKYKTISLWTTNELATAHHLYRAAGFSKTEDITHEIWGKTVVEERYDLRL